MSVSSQYGKLNSNFQEYAFEHTLYGGSVIKKTEQSRNRRTSSRSAPYSSYTYFISDFYSVLTDIILCSTMGW